MACDRWWCGNGFVLLIVVQAILVLGSFSSANADLDYKRSGYSLGDSQYTPNDVPTFDLLEEDGQVYTRRRRGVDSVTGGPPTQEHQPTIQTGLNTVVKVSYLTVTTTPMPVGSVVPKVADVKLPNNNTGTPDVRVSVPIVPPGKQDTPVEKKNRENSKENPPNGSLPAGKFPNTQDMSKEGNKVTFWGNRTKQESVTRNTSTMAPSTSEIDSDLTGIAIGKFPTEVTNSTLKQNNITKTEDDTHQYYNSTFSVDEEVGKNYWIDLDKHPNLNVNRLLSQSHRRAATVKLKFDFPFYGHKVRNITIATGGFLYTGEYVHSWLAATQYIAPLMANFDTTLSNDSYVKYADNGTAFTVEWENVVLQDKPQNGSFSFQVTLLQNGDIIFVYAKIPVLVEKIEDKEHPVKVGLSDAYMMDRTVFFARRKTIYEYHRVNFNRQDIRNWTVIYLRALPTCLELLNCTSCLSKVVNFDCKWCPELNLCSTGTFRFRQDWLLKGCDIRYLKEAEQCPASSMLKETVESRSRHHSEEIPDINKYTPIQQAKIPTTGSLEHARENMSNMGVSGIIGILLAVTLVAGIVAWAAYAYRNPHSASGQMLIRYRPNQWSWRRGEARYTAATIHM